jgi:hypothetical protein
MRVVVERTIASHVYVVGVGILTYISHTREIMYVMGVSCGIEKLAKRA